MQPYQNYYPGMMYQQPIYQAQPMTTGISGKIVNNFSEVMANDVPMNGSVALFAKGDMTEIQAKSWQADGTIKTLKFRPFIEDTNNLPSNAEKEQETVKSGVLDGIMNEIKLLNEKIDRIATEGSETNERKSNSSTRSK